MTRMYTATLRPIDTRAAHPARRCSYWLGGKDHFQADRDSGDAIAVLFPSIWRAVEENRAFARRVVAYLVREAGVRQFLDVGMGFPAPGNTHEVAQAIAPEAKVVYVDNDPIVLSHARALLRGTVEGVIGCVEADLRDPEAILCHPTLGAVLDLSRPVALLLIAVLQFVGDEHDPGRVVRRLVEALPSGSYLVISHPTMDVVASATADAIVAAVSAGGGTFRPRSRAEFSRFFDGLELVEDVGSVIEWRPGSRCGPSISVAETAMYGAVARLP